MFLGNAMWHLREHGAGTTVLYLKLNTYNCDTLGEDPHTAEIRQTTLSMVDTPSTNWPASIPVIARRVDYIHQRYSRDWSELFGVVIHGQPHATITDREFELLRWIDGQRTMAEISKQMKQSDKGADVQEAIRLLARRGIVDLLSEPIAMGKIRGKVVTEAV
jgi:hypothetical protein